MNKKDDFALVPRPLDAPAKSEPRSRQILSGMVAGARALTLNEDLEAIFERGLDYYFGKRVPRDYEVAVKLFRRAAERGHTKAQWRLGL